MGAGEDAGATVAVERAASTAVEGVVVVTPATVAVRAPREEGDAEPQLASAPATRIIPA